MVTIRASALSCVESDSGHVPCGTRKQYFEENGMVTPSMCVLQAGPIKRCLFFLIVATPGLSLPEERVTQ